MAQILRAQQNFQLAANHSLGSLNVCNGQLIANRVTFFETIFNYLCNLFFPSPDTLFKKQAIEQVLSEDIKALEEAMKHLALDGVQGLKRPEKVHLRMIKLATAQLYLALKTENVSQSFRAEHMPTSRTLEDVFLEKVPLPINLRQAKENVSHLASETLLKERFYGQMTDVSEMQGHIHSYQFALFNRVNNSYTHLNVPYDKFQDIYDDPSKSNVLGYRLLRYLLKNPALSVEKKHALLKYSECKLQMIRAWSEELIERIIGEQDEAIFSRLTKVEVHRVLAHCTPAQKCVVLSNYPGNIDHCKLSSEDMVELKNHPEILARFSPQQWANTIMT